ncbi:hypothetical protein CANCADRAFT_148014, partial [Tortispora caseinolytica NRRL Y-17796]
HILPPNAASIPEFASVLAKLEDLRLRLVEDTLLSGNSTGSIAGSSGNGFLLAAGDTLRVLERLLSFRALNEELNCPVAGDLGEEGRLERLKAMSIDRVPLSCCFNSLEGGCLPAILEEYNGKKSKLNIPIRFPLIRRKISIGAVSISTSKGDSGRLESGI